jgi:F-type H+-transporting ATPase subunit b
MEETLRALGLLILKAIPTFILVILLHFYLKWVYFRPMGRVLKARYDATEGARRLAEETLARASEKAAEYEAQLRAARSAIYREQEEFRRRLGEEHAARLQQARQEADAGLLEARRQLAEELEAAKGSLGAQADSLAEEIADTILRRRAA